MGKTYSGKRATVIGTGESGLWAAKLLLAEGAKVRCSSHAKIEDAVKRFFKKTGVEFEEGGHTPEFLAASDLIVPSPGVKPSAPPIVLARERRIPVVGEIELAAGLLKGKWAAVTGTNGKTTTASLLGRMVPRADICGNIGKALSRSLLQKGPRAVRVVEVSSFQLHFAKKVRPTVAVVLNLRPNHLDWHNDLDEYYGAKLNLLRHLGKTGTAVLNADDPALVKLASRETCRKVWFSLKGPSTRGRGPLAQGFAGLVADGDTIFRVRGGKKTPFLSLRKCRLAGPHNRENIMAAAGAALALGARRAFIQKALDAFKPLHHRIEPLGCVGEVAFVNDSKSTTMDSTRAALQSFEGEIVLVAGGRAKEKDFGGIAGLLRSKVRFLALYGEARDFIASQLGGFANKVTVERFDQAVKRAYLEARPGQTLLLSPMCASFDQFGSYEERGEAFRKIFRELKERHG